MSGAPADGLPGRGIVVGSCGGMISVVPLPTLVPMVVEILESKPYLVAHRCNLTQKKYPLPGDVLSIVVDPKHPLELWVDWDQLPTIDERLDAGDPAFTDPDAYQARVAVANQQLVDTGYAMQDEAAGPAAEQLRLARELVKQIQPKAPSPPRSTTPDRPTARVVADSAHGARPGTDDEGSATGYGELLLSVAVPGKPRYGARHRGLIHLAKDLSGDVPVEVDADNPRKVSILWHELPDLIDTAIQKLDEGVAEAEASVAAMSQQGADYLAAAISNPALRAQMAGVMKQMGMSEEQGMAAVEAMPEFGGAGELERLQKLHESGVLTDEEFEREQARLDQT